MASSSSSSARPPTFSYSEDATNAVMADSIGTFDDVQAARRPAPKAHSALAYSRGELVKVWSNTSKAWLPAKVESVFVEATVTEGYSVPAGTVKVVCEIGVKWVMPDNVSAHLRKAEPPRPHEAWRPGHSSAGSVAAGTSGGYPGSGLCIAADSTAGAASETGASSLGGWSFAASSSSSPVLCKNGCGRPVQPGLARGMRPYDTCCKRCAQNPGKDEHDENCGQCRRLGPPGAASGTEARRTSYKRLLEALLKDQAQVQQYVQGMFQRLAGGASTLERDQAVKGLVAVLSQFGMRKEDGSEGYAAEMCRRHGPEDEGAKLGSADFARICQVMLEDRCSIWFPQILPVSTRNFVKKNAQALTDVYELGPKLGQGSFGAVFDVTHKISGEKRVCKRIAKSKGMDSMQILQEIGHMAMLDHPNVIKVYEYFDDGGYVSQIMERCQGGELQDRVEEMRRSSKPPYDEAFVCDVVKQTLRALAFMHKINFLHKDLKPQNIMMVDRSSSSIKVIDFGLAELFQKDQAFSTTAGGTLLYMAPEVFRQEMTTKVDIWSVGVILFNLLTGAFPFMEAWPPKPGKDQAWWQEQTVEKIKRADPPKHERLNMWSSECVDLMYRMLRKQVDARPDAAQCLDHPWFQTFSEAPPPLSVGVVQCMEAYARMSDLKKAIFLFIAHQCVLDAIPELRALFTHFDYRNQGCLSTADMHHILTESGMGALRAERVIHTLDRDGDGMILWTEFIAAAICVSVCRNSRVVDAAFFSIDLDHDGQVVAEDFVRVFAGLDGGSQAAWRKRIGELFTEAMKAPLYSRGGLTESFKSFFANKPTGLAKDKFRSFVGEKLGFRAGDAIYAVT